jgi:hypothetical protein
MIAVGAERVDEEDGGRWAASPAHSVRSAVTGSTRIARRAGTKFAATAAQSSTAIAAPHASGSNALIP